MGCVMTYLIHYVDEGLSFVPFHTPNNIGYLLTRENCLNEGYEFTLGDGATDQASQQGSFIGVENEGCIRGYVNLGETGILTKERIQYWGLRFTELTVTFTPRQYSLADPPIEDTDVTCIEQMVSKEWCAETRKRCTTTETGTEVLVPADLCKYCRISLTA